MLVAVVFVCMGVCGVVTQILAHWMLYGRVQEETHAYTHCCSFKEIYFN